VRAFLVLAGLLALAGMPLLLPSYQLGIASEILIFSVLAMSVNLLAGYAGRTPLCHGAIFGTSTYVVIIAAAAGVPAELGGGSCVTIALMRSPGRRSGLRRSSPAVSIGLDSWV
jgi:ABC-type branched-subunit amino acid transport system permease subunit